MSITLTIPVYRGTLRVYTDRDELISDREEYFPDEESDLNLNHLGWTEEITLEDCTRVYMVGVFDGKVSTLVHELSHVAIFVAARTGWSINDDTSEPFCYLVEALFQECYDKLKNELT